LLWLLAAKKKKLLLLLQHQSLKPLLLLLQLQLQPTLLLLRRWPLRLLLTLLLLLRPLLPLLLRPLRLLHRLLPLLLSNSLELEAGLRAGFFTSGGFRYRTSGCKKTGPRPVLFLAYRSFLQLRSVWAPACAGIHPELA
jgi:hypothetical protein